MLHGKTVIVSGVGPGLGQRVAAACLRDGANVALGARTGDRLAEVAKELDPEGARTAHLATDIADEAQCEALAALALDRFGRTDAVVNVAALDSHFGGLEDADFASWQRVVDVNLFG